MNLTSHRWIAASRPGFVARLGVFAFAALGHYAFLASLLWDNEPSLWSPVLFAAPNLIVLAMVTFGRPQVGKSRVRPTTMVVGVTALVGGTLGLLTNLRSDIVELLCRSVMLAVAGAMCGLMGATVATPLSLAIERWRADHAPRRALDVWATLACMATTFAVTRPQLFKHACLGDPSGCGPGDQHPMLGRLLLPLDLALAALALVIAATVFMLDVWLRRAIAEVRHGRVEGRQVPDVGAVETGAALSLATMHDEEMIALVGPGVATYRAVASEPVLLVFPREPRVSWRLMAMPVVVVLCALGLAYVR